MFVTGLRVAGPSPDPSILATFGSQGNPKIAAGDRRPSIFHAHPARSTIAFPLVKHYSIAFILIVAVPVALLRAADAPALPTPWQHQDIGAVTVAGSASAAGDVFTLKGTLDIWGMTDGCHFAWRTLTGDGAIVARVLSVELSGHAKGGLAIRESLDAGSRHATMAVTPADGSQFLVRAETGAVTTVQKTGLNKGTMPYWLKLVRAGDQLTGFESTDGKTWTQTGTATVKLPATVHIGLVASSHQKDKLCTVPFDHVTVTSP